MSARHHAAARPRDAGTAHLRLPDPAVRVAVLLVFVLCVVVTPIRVPWAFPLLFAVLLFAAVPTGVPAGLVARRLAVVLPFLGFAVALAFVGSGPRLDLGWLSVSETGTWSGAGMLVKSTLAVAAASVLSWTTPVADLLVGLRRLHCPDVMVTTCGLMVRYIEVVAAELHRLRVARLSRGDDPRWFWQGRAVASTAGALFVRSYERGERVHHAMLSRGFDGSYPAGSGGRPAASAWPAAGLALASAAIAGVALGAAT